MKEQRRRWAEEGSLQESFDLLRKRHGVVGASLALLDHGRVELACGGVLSQDTRVPVSTESVFQIGSISKVFTASLMMQLVDEGRLDLDEPVCSYLSSFALSDRQASQTITSRQLLSHTSGIEGDFFPADALWRSAVERYVDQCRLLPQLHPVGEYFSYCNSGFSIAGRVIEVLSGQPWHVAVRERIFAPLEMHRALADPSELPRFSAAMGHESVTGECADLVVAKRCFLPPGLAPAGSVLAMSPLELLRFVRCHLAGGIADSGKRVLSESSVEAMQESQVRLPSHFPLGATDWGLGWYLGNRTGERFFGHNGETIGQHANLNVYPEYGFAICLLTNSPSAEFFAELETELLGARFGLEIQRSKVPEAPLTVIATKAYCGSYRNIEATIVVTDRQGTLRARYSDSSGRCTEHLLVPFAEHSFRLVDHGPGPDQVLQFVIDRSGHRASYVLAGSRLLRRVEDPESESGQVSGPWGCGTL